jgi:branched-chain amino acid transport system ATP-binding protein
MLTLDQVWAAYDPNVPVLKGVSLALSGQETVAVLGANGAGKSTLLRLLSGLLPCLDGRIQFDGVDITRTPPDRRVQMGIVQVPEGRQMLTGMSVEENLMLGGYVHRRDGAGLARALEEIYALFPVLLERRKQLAGSLSGGQQQMVSIGRALMARPRILLCDEPSFGLAPLVVRDIFVVLQGLRSRGIQILLVEQNAKKAL